jgi:hypothetical protein
MGCPSLSFKKKRPNLQNNRYLITVKPKLMTYSNNKKKVRLKPLLQYFKYAFERELFETGGGNPRPRK